MRKLVLIICIACAPAYSASIYVDGTLGGNCTGNYSIASRTCSGSDGNAYVTIQAASAASTAGDTIYIREGTYYPATRINFANKTATSASNKITLTVYNSEAVIIDGTSTVPGSGYGIITITNSDYIVLDGFTLQNSSQRGIYHLSSSYCQSLNLDVGNIQKEALYFHHSDHATITNCTVHDGGNDGIYIQESDYCNTTYCLCYANFGVDVGSGIRYVGSSYGLIDRNECYDNYKGVFLIWYSTTSLWSSYNTVTNNLCYNNDTTPQANDGITSSTNTSYNTISNNVCYGNHDDGIDCSTGGGNYNNLYETITHNLCFYNGDVADAGNGNGIKVSTNNGGGHLVAKNVVFGNERGGFDQDKPALGDPPNYFYYNTAYNNGTDPTKNAHAGYVMDASILPQEEDAVLYGNIGSGNLVFDIYNRYDTAVQDADYNFWGDGVFVLGMDANSKSGDPKFLDPDAVVDTTFQEGWTIDQKLAHIRDQVRAMFSLQSDSPCIEAGTVIAGFHNAVAGPGPLEDWYNSAPDMGAYEYTPNPTWNHSKVLILRP